MPINCFGQIEKMEYEKLIEYFGQWDEDKYKICLIKKITFLTYFWIFKNLNYQI